MPGAADSLLPAAGFTPAPCGGPTTWWQPGREPRVVVLVPRSLSSPTGFLEDCQAIGNAIRADLFDERIGHATNHPILEAMADLVGVFSPLKRQSLRLRYQILLLWEPEEAPDWIDSMIGGAGLDLPKRCLVPAIRLAGGDLRLPKRPDAHGPFKNCCNWATDILG